MAKRTFESQIDWDKAKTWGELSVDDFFITVSFDDNDAYIGGYTVKVVASHVEEDGHEDYCGDGITRVIKSKDDAPLDRLIRLAIHSAKLVGREMRRG